MFINYLFEEKYVINANLISLGRMLVSSLIEKLFFSLSTTQNVGINVLLHHLLRNQQQQMFEREKK